MNVLQEFAYTIGSNFEVAVREKVKTSQEKQSSAPHIDPESLSTFKITADEQEQESRDALRLPYEKYVIKFQILLMCMICTLDKFKKNFMLICVIIEIRVNNKLDTFTINQILMMISTMKTPTKI